MHIASTGSAGVCHGIQEADIGVVNSNLRFLLVNAAHIIWSQAVLALEYAVLHASIPPGAAAALRGRT